MENPKINEIQTNRLFDYIKVDDADALGKELAENPELKGLKLGNLPLASVAVLLRAKKCTDLLLPLFGEINAYVEADAPSELSEKWQNLLTDYAESTTQKNTESEKDASEKSNLLSALYEGARFVEPCETAFLSEDINLANQIIAKVGIKTVSARKRLETIFEERKTYAFSGKAEKCRIVNTLEKSKKGLTSKRKKILYFSLILIIAIMIPLLVLTTLRVKVTYYVDSKIYGQEQGIGGEKISIDDPQKEGHTFIGWFLDEELTRSSENKLPKKSGKLYAGWELNCYTIKLDCDYLPIGSQKENTGKYGTMLNLPIPKVDGKLFLGWFDENDELVTSNIYKQDVVLKAKFVDFEDNSPDNPFEIKKQEEFLYLYDQEGYFTIMDGLVIEKNYLSSGILSDNTKGFAGRLDGQGKTLFYRGVFPLFCYIGENGSIENLNIIVQESNALLEYTVFDKYGVVAVVNSGLIENLRITFKKDNESQTTENLSLSSMWLKSYLGTIAGSNSGTIRSCYVDGNFDIAIGSATHSIAFMGGLVGANIGRIENSVFSAVCSTLVTNRGFGAIAGYNAGIIENCSNNGEIKADAFFNINGSLSDYVARVGGIVAVNGTSESDRGLTVGEIVSCTNNADITISNHNIELCVGGIASYSESVISSCENNGKITIKDSANVQYIGGVAGFSASRGQGEIKDCTNNAQIETVRKGYSYLGGIAGYSISSKADDKLNILRCTNLGKLTDGTQMGGIIGYAVYSSLSECINKGEISSTTTSENDSTKAIGGLIGGTTESTITRCFNHGGISHSVSATCKKANYIGGLIADNIDSIISDSANTASVSYAENDVAGLICAVINSKDGYAEIKNTYAVDDKNTVAFYAYSSATDENNHYIDHVDGDLSRPALYPDSQGLLKNAEEIFERIPEIKE